MFILHVHMPCSIPISSMAVERSKMGTFSYFSVCNGSKLLSGRARRTETDEGGCFALLKTCENYNGERVQ